MNKTEIKIYNVEGKEFEFNISTENKDFQFLTANINITRNQSEFREIDGSSEILKKILSYYLFENLKKYTVLKTASIETENEFQGVFEFKDILKFPSNFTRNVKLTNSEESVNVNINIEKEFKQCLNYIQNRLNDSTVYINPMVEIFDELIFNCFIEENDRLKLTVNRDSGKSIIRKATDDLFLEKFGESFVADLVAERFCSHFEIQQKFKFYPKILR